MSHDAGAYRRSRQTAVRLIRENMPVQASLMFTGTLFPRATTKRKWKGSAWQKFVLYLEEGIRTVRSMKSLPKNQGSG